MKSWNLGLLAGATLALLTVAQPARAEDKEVPLELELPKALAEGTPAPVKLPNLEQPREGKRPAIMVPAGLVNLAKDKTVTSSDTEPVIGDLTLIGDGDKSGQEGSFVELAKGKQWVQIDLGQSSEIFAIALWHYHAQARAYKDVVVQISDEPDFVTNVKTLFNSDDDNSSGLGVGKDRAYIETNEGKLIETKGAKARYIRFYSAGNTSNAMNHYVEIEVWGRPAK